MKVLALFVVTLAAASAFAPSPAGRSNTELNESLFDKIFNMDLYAPNKGVNDYGARSKKSAKTASLGSNSYIPSGLSKAQYEKVRSGEVAKKNANYAKNVKKAGIFEDYTAFYIKRGTDTKQDWKKSVTLGHRMAKTKYDMDASKFGKKYDGGK